MKKIMPVILIIILFFSGCEVISNEGKLNSEESTKGTIDMEMIDFKEIKQVGIDWEKIEFPIDSKKIKIPADVKSILTKEDAFRVGKAIIENFWNNNKYVDYSLLTVVHSTEDNIWRFDYSIDQRNKTDGIFVLGNSFYVAINGNDGKLIQAWVEE